MVEKFFMHRIQEENNVFSKGIEIHDTLDAAILSFWGRMKLAYGGNPAITFMSCKIKDSAGNVIAPYNLTWNANEVNGNKFFLHYVRLDGENYSKDIDICESFDAARAAFAEHMEYGYKNPKHPNVSLVSCEITDRSGSVMIPFDKTWQKQEEEPEEEQEPETQE